jgi:hypothetical protein
MNEIQRWFKVATLALYAFLAFGSATAYARDVLNPDEMLKMGESLNSANGKYKLILGEDGNLVLYNQSNKALWSSKTNGKSVEKCLMQSDGNFVCYLRDRTAVWASNTAGKPHSYLSLQNDGNLVIYRTEPLWATNTKQ